MEYLLNGIFIELNVFIETVDASDTAGVFWEENVRNPFKKTE